MAPSPAIAGKHGNVYLGTRDLPERAELHVEAVGDDESVAGVLLLRVQLVGVVTAAGSGELVLLAAPMLETQKGEYEGMRPKVEKWMGGARGAGEAFAYQNRQKPPADAVDGGLAFGQPRGSLDELGGGFWRRGSGV